VQRQRQIEDDLDLSKNQASAQLDANSASELPSSDTEANSLKKDALGDCA
jgi:hypothetical protein